MVYEICCKSAIHSLKRKQPYGLDLNIYRGCSHGCRYCYAQGSQQYLTHKNFFQDIHVKTNIVEILEKELRAKGEQASHDIINLGGVTDNYQVAEETYQLMPEILKLFIQYKVPVIISTKSILPLRDFDLIEELASLNYVNIAASIITLDESLRKKLELGSAPALKRFELLREFRKTNASIGLHLMPIMPYLTDQQENLEAILAYGQEVDVDYVLPGTLYLRGLTRP